MRSTDQQETNNDRTDDTKKVQPEPSLLRDEEVIDKSALKSSKERPKEERRGWLGGISKTFQNILHTITHDSSYDTHLIVSKTPNNAVPKKILYGTFSEEEHYKKIKEYVTIAKSKKGREGLELLGLEYRLVYCNAHNNINDGSFPRITQEEKKCEMDGMGYGCSEVMIMKVSDEDVTVTEMEGEHCHECCTKLFHMETNLAIEEENRRWFIADGEMYEEVTRLCQEYAQYQMEVEGQMEWIVICNDQTKGEPIRALVTKKHASFVKSSQTIIIATGNGKVRAGIFSRQHLLITGIEASTALPIVREATRRGMSVVLLDPNARGDRHAMCTFEQSLNTLNQENNPLYVLAHSAAGAQLVQYLNQSSNKTLLQHIKAVAFTDSTHNIQWTKNNHHLSTLLQSDNCLYFKSSNPHRDDNWDKTIAGEKVCTDDFWRHRFGSIRTLWAGTHEHSLTNWFARNHIWDHFDLAPSFTPPVLIDSDDEKEDKMPHTKSSDRINRFQKVLIL